MRTSAAVVPIALLLSVMSAACSTEPVTMCEPACDANACMVCDPAGGACVSACGEGATCSAGRCVADSNGTPACDLDCGPCEACVSSAAGPACVALCGAEERCESGICQRNGLHANLAALQGSFASGSDVTAACLDCHASAGEEFLHTAHWNWAGPNGLLEGHTSGGSVGKRNLINNFCIATASNEPRCTQCHAGYGWRNDDFDFSDSSRIDCLVCHADPRSGYKKDPKAAGEPVAEADLGLAARSVGAPGRQNCGACHFTAGGGDNVKNGDLGSALASPSRSADVHMGAGMTCANCHAGPDHTVLGQGAHIGVSEARLACSDCHGAAPHRNATLDEHSRDIACQTCHIPAYSRQQPTKMDWDWSTVGNRTLGNNGVVTGTLEDGTQVVTYDAQKGDFVWEKNVRPVFAWYDGRVRRMTIFDTYPEGRGTEENPVILGEPVAGYADGGAKIFPFKLMRGRQPADKVRRIMIVPHLFGPGGLWASIPAADAYTPEGMRSLWSAALTSGARTAGQIAPEDAYADDDWTFAHTRLYMGINHEVAPREASLQCNDCHGSSGSFDFAALGYACDPMTNPAACGSRHVP